VIKEGGALFSTLNVNLLDVRDDFEPAPPVFHYDHETEDERRARRRARWTPTTLHGA
jgi:hypothetical protein